MHGFIESFKTYLFRKAVADAIAFLILVGVWALIPDLLTIIFDFNAWWVGLVWTAWISPYLPAEVDLAATAVRAAHDAIMAALDLGTKLAEKTGFPVDTSRAEVTVRILLIGEIWLVKIQLSWLLRICYRLDQGWEQLMGRKPITSTS